MPNYLKYAARFLIHIVDVDQKCNYNKADLIFGTKQKIVFIIKRYQSGRDFSLSIINKNLKQ
ncbi:hypothetical protein SAMN05661044_01344 [Olivibacter domesticus]|uniref:Uncharacterized protein n=1 Tax=Olivibacter domesticus TaxID=407022 RepID=A0A1H7KGF1_OLID1|nr:hypothetical protein SAMN05661044_01344 [Olivibacter domesticus]